MRLEEIDLAAWERALPASGREVFHDPAALEVVDAHARGRLELYAAYKGDRPVGLMPVFVEENPLGRAYLSPPPSMGVPRLGPLVMAASPKQGKRESVNREFVELVTDALDVDDRRSLFRAECGLGYADPRPFAWADFDLDLAFTYVLDLGSTTREDVLGGFSSALRREVRRGDELDIEVAVEGTDAAMRVYDDLTERYGEQGLSVPFSRPYFRDVVDALEDRSRVYVARDGDGAYLGGLVVLLAGDTAAYWAGGAAASHEGISVNSVLHWSVITDVLTEPALEDVTAYDLVGANTPRLCRYKSKFGADLVPYYTVESGGLGMAVAKRAYRLLAPGQQ